MITLSKTERLLAFKKWVESRESGFSPLNPDEIWMAAVDWAEKEIYKKRLMHDSLFPPTNTPPTHKLRRK